MKLISLLLIVLTFSCASLFKKGKESIPKFKRKNVCSYASLEYLDKKKAALPVGAVLSKETVSKKMKKIDFDLGKCYQQEVERNKYPPAFNLCFVTGYDKDGNQEYFEFSSKEHSISSELSACLNQLKSHKALQKGPKGFGILRPFRLYPKPRY